MSTLEESTQRGLYLLGIQRTRFPGTMVRSTSSTFPFAVCIIICIVNLPGSWCVWAATEQASFLHGRFTWSHWDVLELASMKERFSDAGFLKMGLQGIDPVSPAALFAMV